MVIFSNILKLVLEAFINQADSHNNWTTTVTLTKLIVREKLVPHFSPTSYFRILIYLDALARKNLM